jgi:hypothetical protein
MRIAATIACLALILVACGGGTLTITEYAAQAEELVTTARLTIETLDAELDSQILTVDGVRTYWDRRMEAREEFLEGLQAFDPPDEAVDLHGVVVELLSKLNAAEKALSVRVATFETVTGPGEWWDTPEGHAARAIDEEATALCHVAQAEFDKSEGGEAFADMPWIPSEMREVVRVAFGCSE